MSTGASSDDPVVAGILLARLINGLCGAAVVRPWEVDQLPDEWLDAFMMLGKRLGA